MNICKWYNDANSPVVFMIDDLANVWVDTNNNGKIDIEEDWGYAGFSENSSFRYLEKNILKDFENIKITFFVPVGNRVGMIENPCIKSTSRPINSSNKSKEFFKKINDSTKFEIAYHGTDHGRVGKTNEDFIQEWELFNSVEEANLKTRKGIDIYIDTLGKKPLGGKYCGYMSNQFSDCSIDELKFLWWCRFCNLDTEDAFQENRLIKEFHGTDTNFITNNDIKIFGKNNIIDIPTTVNGGLLTGIYSKSGSLPKKIFKILFPQILARKKLKIIDNLIENKLVISIQEHISPARDDGRRQTPNIYDDTKSLVNIFKYLKNKNIWNCTCSELASYVYYRENIKFEMVEGGFTTNFNVLKKYEYKHITIKLEDIKNIETPSGEILNSNKGIFNIKLEVGKYRYIQ
ncbi:hypothetical protein [Clostridium baratii]|uniref:hypothetical protein n=1 Tax=Clostridium baratii TaxID=1561 RepID=UPI002900D4A9|nr:hypothetical protein [Clostridium baratii]MDU1055300.1 hypothetical protein [Clostridium baratii]